MTTQNTNAKEEVQLNCVIIKDQTVNRVAMYIAEIPEVIADGKDEEEALQNLATTLNDAFDDRKKNIIEKLGCGKT